VPDHDDRPPSDLAGSWARAMDAGADPLSALQATRAVKDGLGAWEAHLARKALAAGETWESIGAALGISRQAAWERLRSRIAEEIESDRRRVRAKRDEVRERSRGWAKTKR
jgi:hypothetical protein